MAWQKGQSGNPKGGKPGPRKPDARFRRTAPLLNLCVFEPGRRGLLCRGFREIAAALEQPKQALILKMLMANG
jgi:hypothetical protein